MSIKNDRWIREMALTHKMIEPFEPKQVRANGAGRIVSYGVSSYGYDVRCADEFKIFTNINSTIVDPKAFDARSFVDIKGAIGAIGRVGGLLALLLFSTFNNFLGGVFMSLMDPYGLTLMSVEAWGILIAITSLGFIAGGIVIARRGLGVNPVRTLLLAVVVMWTVTIVFPIRSEIVPLAIGFFVYLFLAPVAEASEQTVIQRVVPFEEQGWIASEWGTSDNNREAKFYRLTRRGERQLAIETENWERMAGAVARVLRAQG